MLMYRFLSVLLLILASAFSPILQELSTPGLAVHIDSVICFNTSAEVASLGVLISKLKSVSVIT